MRGLVENVPLKLVSLALATLLWFVIAAEKTSEIGVVARVELQNFPRDLELTGDPVNTVEVRIRASPSVIQRLAPADVAALVDLAGTGEGETIVHLSEKSIRIPFGVKVVKITPSILTLNFERSVEKTVPVRPRLLGRPADHFEVAEISASPARVRIAGPRTRVQEVESAFTEPLSVEGARGSVTEKLTIGLEDPVLRILESPQASVTARVVEVQGERVLPEVDVELRGGAGRLRPSRVSVVLTGPLSVLGAVGPADVRAWVDAGGAGPRRRVNVALRGRFPGVAIARHEPAEVAFRPALRD